MIKVLNRLRTDNSGATMIEYGVIVLVFGFVMIALNPALRGATVDVMHSIANKFETEVK